MTIAWMLAAAALLAPAVAHAAAEPAPAAAAASALPRGIPSQLDRDQRQAYAAVFAAVREARWTDAQLLLDAMKPGPLHAVARAEMFTAKGSPRIELEPLVALLNEAPELPQAEALARLARARGAVELPPLPAQQRLVWQDGAPRRVRAKSVKADEIAAALALTMQPFVKADDGPGAEALLDATEGLTPEALTEWQAKVAWMYFLSGDDAKARELAARGAAGAGDWATQARWMGSLAGWRAGDCAGAGVGFEGVAARAVDADFRAAGLYWAARADMMCGRPDRIEARLKAAAQYRESFYGQLARQALGLKERASPATPIGADWAALDARPNVRVAAALVEAGETELADKVIRQQARIGRPAEFGSLVRLAETLDLPATAVWLAHNCPTGITAEVAARYPTPNWAPASGWRVDRSLVYAHTLEESGFRQRVESQAGAYGLMQIRAALASDFGREQGTVVDKKALAAPATNMDVGQRYLERLRDMSGTTGGLLPKVIAAYNAGPKPVAEWNAVVRDGGDPLLYIESIPYWETRGYVTTVLRNYWMYEAQGGRTKSASRSALAQGMWPRFPGMAGASAVRLDARASATASASVAGASAGGGLN